jgi:hypothetical protein
VTYDWAMLEALEEVDALTPSCPPIAPPKRDPMNTGLAMMQMNAWQVNVSANQLQNAVMYVNQPGQSHAQLMANQAGRESIEAALRLRGTR